MKHNAFSLKLKTVSTVLSARAAELEAQETELTKKAALFQSRESALQMNLTALNEREASVQKSRESGHGVLSVDLAPQNMLFEKERRRWRSENASCRTSRQNSNLEKNNFWKSSLGRKRGKLL